MPTSGLVDESRDIFHVSEPDFSESDLALFRSVTTELTEEFVFWLNESRLCSPSRHYPQLREHRSEVIHYTSLDGFVAIARTMSLYATNLFSVNDGSEILGAFSDIERLVRSQLYEATPVEKDFLEYLIHRMMLVGDKEPPRSFVVSFTDMPDKTLHRQGYGRSDGLALHMDYNLLEKRFRHESSLLFRCIYDQVLKRKVIQEMFVRCKQARRKYVRDFMPVRLVHLVKHAIIFAHAQFFPMFKHPQFSHEREWRLVYYNRSDASPDCIRVFR